MKYEEALNIWKRNGLLLPELPVDRSIFPNANKLLKIEEIKKELLEACKAVLSENDRSFDDRDILVQKLIIEKIKQTIAKAEGGER